MLWIVKMSYIVSVTYFSVVNNRVLLVSSLLILGGIQLLLGIYIQPYHRPRLNYIEVFYGLVMVLGGIGLIIRLKV